MDNAVDSDGGGGWRALLPALLLMIGSGIAIPALSWSGTGGRVIVVSAPWRDTGDAVRIVAAAHGQVLSGGPFANIMLATSEAPSFVSELYRAGAWLVIGAGQSNGCMPR